MAAAFRSEAAFYVRPALQFSSLTDSHTDADIGIGGGIAVGAAMGRQQNFDVGAEYTSTRYKGTFESQTYNYPSGWARQVAPVRCTTDTILGTFRYVFGAKDKNFRPFLGLAGGFSSVHITAPSANAQASTGTCWTAAVGGGVTYRVGRLTCIDFGYRYIFSDAIVPFGILYPNFSYKFRYNAHAITIALDQRF